MDIWKQAEKNIRLLADNRYITLKKVKLKYNIINYLFTENLHNQLKSTKTKEYQKQRERKREMEEE